MSSLKQGLLAAVALGPASVTKLRPKGWTLFALYLAAAAAILGFVGWQFAAHKQDLVAAISEYLFPDGWQFATRALLDRFLASQARDVLVNAVIGAALITVQIFLFPLKEKLSATFEREAKLTDQPGRELPLWVEALEEINLFFLFLTAQMCIFWIGYPPDPWRKTLATVLSYLFLFASFGIDFLSPILQRHTFKYSTMFKVFARHPLTVVAFGAVFTLPVVIVGKIITAQPTWSFGLSLGLLFGVNVVCIAWAAVAGTYVGSKLLPEARETSPPHPFWRVTAFVVIAALLGWNGYRFGAIGLALHHKSQILKCDYSVNWGSASIDTPKLSDLLKEKLSVGVGVEITIHNPTKYDVVIEKNHLDVKHGKDRVATASLSPVSIPAGKTVTQRISFPVELSIGMVRKGKALFKPSEWSLVLWLDVAPGFEFPIYLVGKG